MGATENERLALELLAEVSGTPPGELRPEAELVADLGIDSPKALRLFVELEDRLGVELEDEQAAGLNTVGDVLALVQRLGPQHP